MNLKLLFLYLLTIPVFFLIDILWLGVFAKDFYREQLSGFLAEKTNWPAAMVFYLLFIVGILYFAVYPALVDNNFSKAILNGALFGLFTYGTFDLTNYALLKDWPFKVVWIDILWGMFLTASVATISFLIAKKFLGF